VIANQRGDPSASHGALVALADKTVAVLERAGDDAQLAMALHEAASYRGWLGRYSEAAPLFERTLVHARAGGDFYIVRASIEGRLGAEALGSTPVSKVFAFLDALPADIRALASDFFPVHLFKAMMEAYSGNVGRARAEYERALALAAETGKRDDPIWGSPLRMFGGVVELVSESPGEAEKILRPSYDRLSETQAHGMRSTIATLLADALTRQGHDDEAINVLDVADEIAQADDFDPQVRSRFVRARILARRGDIIEANRLSAEAVELIAVTEQIVLHGEALVARAEVLQASGNLDGCEARLREALELFERKESTAHTVPTRELLAKLSTNDS
jgi:ATP/maltotriose-dependent transcriptional regulator MalT